MRATSRWGGTPKRRLYSRLNCDGFRTPRARRRRRVEVLVQHQLPCFLQAQLLLVTATAHGP